MNSPSKASSLGLITILIVSCLCALILAGTAWSTHVGQAYTGKILPHVSVGDIELGGLSKAAANEKLHQALGSNKVRAVSVRLKGTTYTLKADTPSGSFIEPASALADKAYAVGRSTNPVVNAWDRLRLSLWSKQSLSLAVEVSPDKLKATLEPKIQGLLHPATDASLRVTSSSTVIITPDQTGTDLDWEVAAKTIQTAQNHRQTTPIDLTLNEAQANLTSSDLEPLRAQAENWLSKPALTLVTTSTPSGSWKLATSTLATWIDVTSSAPHAATLELNANKADATFRSWLGNSVRVAQDGLLELDDQGKLKNFVAPRDGFGPDTTTTLAQIQAAWANNATSTTLAVRTEQPVIRGEAAESLGIRELIGRGTSDFGGSPSNRIKNITLGAERVNGTIVKAGEEFSMIKTLGEIDGAHGWLPELVIKGNKTTPEFGGGLCQIGTTAFRAAMNTGLEITQRQNHSYRVRYYEPAGTDATIYDPSPDFRFKNDTAHAILITTQIQGTQVIFSFWGTRDGRVGTIGKSVITNVTAPPPTKLIETTDLPVGTKKCTETAHAGATARVDYTVNYADGQSKKVTFTSVYRPWQAVCLIGVAALSTPAANPGAIVDQTGGNNLN